MERIRDADSVLEVPGDAAPVALGEVGGDHLDRLEPPWVLLGAPSAQVSGAVALDHVDDLGIVEIDHARRVERGVLPRRREERRLVDAERPDLAHPSGIVDERGAVELDGVHDGPPAHPELASHDGDGEGQRTHLARGFGAGAHGEHGASRDVRRSLGPGLGSQSGSAQHQRRLSQTSRAGRPKQGRSRMSTRLRSLASARTPQHWHPTTSAVVSTVMHTSSGFSRTSSTRKPSSPTSASARPVASSIVRGLLRCRLRTTATIAGPLAAFADTPPRATPYSDRRAALIDHLETSPREAYAAYRCRKALIDDINFRRSGVASTARTRTGSEIANGQEPPHPTEAGNPVNSGGPSDR